MQPRPHLPPVPYALQEEQRQQQQQQQQHQQHQYNSSSYQHLQKPTRPPIPPGILADHQQPYALAPPAPPPHLLQAPSSPSSHSQPLLPVPLSPRPQRPQGGAVDSGTTAQLEKQASIVHQHQHHQPPGQYGSSTSAGSPSDPATMSSTTAAVNPRIANWVATSAAGGPGFAAYVNSARGDTPQPQVPRTMQQQQQQNSLQPHLQPSTPGQYIHSPPTTHHQRFASAPAPGPVPRCDPNTPRLDAASGTVPTVRSPMSMYTTAVPQQQPPALHHAMSEMNLSSSSASSIYHHHHYASSDQLYPRQERSASQVYPSANPNRHLDPNGSNRVQPQYTTSRPISSPAAAASYRLDGGSSGSAVSTPLLAAPSSPAPPPHHQQYQSSMSQPASRRSSLVPPSGAGGTGSARDGRGGAPTATRPSSTYSNPSDPTGAPPTLCIALPTQAELASQRDQVHYAPDPAQAKVTWAKNVMKFVERFQASATPSSSGETSKITDPVLVKWTDESLRIILQFAEPQATPSGPVAEALYLRGELSNSGKFPSYRVKDLSSAFRDFEAAANAGFDPAWAKIALAYENFGETNNSKQDFDRAKKAYEEGLMRNEVTCTYRIAMAHLLGQLGFQQNPAIAIPLLRQAAGLSTIDDPLPAYIYGMLLAGELDLGAAINTTISPHLLVHEQTAQPQDPKPWIERSAYLGYAPAQFKMGFNYEYAAMGCGYDPLLSVQYYSLASQQGDIEADMALSKWFLCGSEAFDLQESLAFTFAEKAARKGLPSAEFALGYYFEIGIGGRKDVEASKRWYTKAAAHGNTDASDRLTALTVNASNVLSRDQHESQINDKIVRRRTQAKVDADKRRTSSLSQQQQQQQSPHGKASAVPSMPAIPAQYQQPPAINGPVTTQTKSADRPPRQSSMGLANKASESPSHSKPGRAATAAYDNYNNPSVSVPDVAPTTDLNSPLRRRETLKLAQQAAMGQQYSGITHERRTSSFSSSANLAPQQQPQGPRTSQQQQSGSRLRSDQLSVPTGPNQIQRYSLVDSGPALAPTTTISSPSPATPNGSNGHTPAGVSIVNNERPALGPQTFEAMGLKTGKVKAEQECIIS